METRGLLIFGGNIMTKEMEDARDLIVKMTFEGASKEELAKAIKYSRDLIETHKESSQKLQLL